MMATLRKFWAAAGVAVLGLFYMLFSDGGMSSEDWAILLTQGGTAVLVWYVENTGGAWYAKAAAAAFGGFAVVFMTVFTGGVNPNEWGMIGTSILQAVLVFILRNAGAPVSRPVQMTQGGTVQP
jgi:hypothetical protein